MYEIIKFLYKYMFILKAASDGWRIRYIGGNSFKFYNKRSQTPKVSIEDFMKKYQYTLIT